MSTLAVAAWLLQAGAPAAPEAYGAHVRLENLTLAAEYLARSFSGSGQTFVTPAYLVIEVALIANARLQVSHGQFSLRINGKKQSLHPQAPAFVAASLKYPDWEQRPEVAVAAGPVIIGPPRPAERFPGDPRPAQGRLPKPPRVPTESQQPREPEVKAEEVALEAALPEGDLKLPVRGYLYFAYKGKIKSIRTLELSYTGPAGKAVLKLL